MDTPQAHRLFVERMFLDNINHVPVWVEPAKPPSQHDVNVNITETIAHLRVVSEGGTLFTVDDLHEMSLNRDEIGHIEQLCRRRLIGMTNKYLPRGTKNVVFVSGVCRIVEYSRIEVVFSIKGTLLKHQHHSAHH